MAQHFSLKWKNYAQNVVNSFASLKANDDLTDVTLLCDGRKIKCHKVLLSACSNYFKKAFRDNVCPHPIVILFGVEFVDLEVLVKFMYNGQASVNENRLTTFLNTAQLLQIKGLADVNSQVEDEPPPASDGLSTSPQDQQYILVSKRKSIVLHNAGTEIDGNTVKVERKSIKLSSSAETGDRFLCIICDKDFKNKNVLYNHRSVYHRNNPALAYGSTETVRIVKADNTND